MGGKGTAGGLDVWSPYLNEVRMNDGHGALLAALPPPLPEESGMPALDADGLLGLYREMLLIRRLEEAAAKAYTMRKILGFCHLYIGQEAVAVGAAAATRKDYWIAAYREHGHALAKGSSARAVMAELYGKATGASKGLGGSMHIFDRSVDFMGGYGIVGAHVALANGVAWASRHRDEGRVVVCFFGDGASHQGAFFEGLALSALYKLPVVYICENNFYAMGTPLHRQSAYSDMSLRALGVGITREQVTNGMDVEHVRERVGAAARYAREGNGPVFLEIVTYRFRGHSMSDPAKYRPAGELEEKKKSDPLLLTADRLRTAFGVGEARLTEVETSVEAEVEDAVRFAEQSPEPDPADLYRYVYAPAGQE